MLWEAVVVTVAAWYIYLQSLAKKCQILHHFLFTSDQLFTSNVTSVFSGTCMLLCFWTEGCSLGYQSMKKLFPPAYAQTANQMIPYFYECLLPWL